MEEIKGKTIADVKEIYLSGDSEPTIVIFFTDKTFCTISATIDPYEEYAKLASNYYETSSNDFCMEDQLQLGLISEESYNFYRKREDLEYLERQRKRDLEMLNELKAKYEGGGE